jgi:hypothetical protein
MCKQSEGEKKEEEGGGQSRNQKNVEGKHYFVNIFLSSPHPSPHPGVHPSFFFFILGGPRGLDVARARVAVFDAASGRVGFDHDAVRREHLRHLGVAGHVDPFESKL